MIIYLEYSWGRSHFRKNGRVANSPESRFIERPYCLSRIIKTLLSKANSLVGCFRGEKRSGQI